MNRSIKKSKSPLKHNKIVDSVSATELLQALHTLQHISTVEEQLTEDLNISFSQNNNFSHTNQLSLNLNTSESVTYSKFNKLKNTINKKQSQSQKDNQNSKMNFQFYMTKKQNKYQNKNNYLIDNQKNNTQKNGPTTITPKKKPIQQKQQTQQKSLSPLTQKSTNTLSVIKQNHSIISGKQLKIKNQSLTPTKLPLKSINTQNKDQINYTITNKQNQTQIYHPNLTQRQIKKPQQQPSTIHQLSIHERNKEFLHKKNQKLAKLCQQIEQKKKQQDKQCTFKPKIITNNSHIKSKYNDLCASRQYYEKTHKRCKTGKQNLQNCFEDNFNLKVMRFKDNKTKINQLQQSSQQQLEFESTAKMSIDQCDSRVKNSTSASQKDTENISMVKKKYKNSKFNILLDLIH